MPSLSQHQSNSYTKMLLEGDSGSGKTGSLTSLVAAGYKLRILDYDNGLESLKQYVLRDCPQGINNVEYRTLRDARRPTDAGPVIDGIPKAFVDGVKMLGRWQYETTDLGSPAEWGPEAVLVLDSLTLFSDAAFNFHKSLLARPGGSKYDIRAVYKSSQDAVEETLNLLTGENFRTNVIVISHIRYVDNPDGTRKGYPESVGSALCPIIPLYFNSVAMCQTKGGKRTLQTAATNMVDLKNPKPFEMKDNYPLDTGLSDFFKVLRDQPLTRPIDQPAVQSVATAPIKGFRSR